MKILLDENIPLKLRHELETHEVYTVSYQQWTGVQNGELLEKMLAEGFEVLITFDQHLAAQQNFETYPIPVLVLKAKDNSFLTLQTCVPRILDVLSKPLKIGVTTLVLD